MIHKYKETVTPQEPGDYTYVHYEQGSLKLRDIDMMHEDGIVADVGTEVLAPCGDWKSYLGSPSCTKMCNDDCPIAKECKEELGIN